MSLLCEEYDVILSCQEAAYLQAMRLLGPQCFLSAESKLSFFEGVDVEAIPSGFLKLFLAQCSGITLGSS